LIARSYDRGNDLRRFVLARAARLFPALIASAFVRARDGSRPEASPILQTAC
jgi:hypothetical protein